MLTLSDPAEQIRSGGKPAPTALPKRRVLTAGLRNAIERGARERHNLLCLRQGENAITDLVHAGAMSPSTDISFRFR
jgi:hypothetical protein